MSEKDKSDFVEEKEIPIRNLEYAVSKRHDEGHIDRIAESIALTGLLNPIIVHPIGTNRWKVDAGEGRIQSHIRLGRKSIRARIYQEDPLLNELRHLVENLDRVEVDTYEWDRLVTRRLEIIEILDPKHRAIKDANRPPKKSKVNDSGGLETSGTDIMSDAPRQLPPVAQVALELGCNQRSIERAKRRIKKTAPPVTESYAKGDLTATQVDELVKIADPDIQSQAAVEAVGKTVEETKEIVTYIVRPPSERLESEMKSAIKLAGPLAVRLQTIKRLIEIEGMEPSSETRALFNDAINGLKICLG